MNILVGDIGGTNIRLLYSQINNEVCDSFYEGRYSSHDFRGLTEVLNKFFLDNDITERIEAACFAIAGPIEKGVVSVTNLPWVISEAELKDELHTSQVIIINDFLAVALGISELNENDYIILQEGLPYSERVNGDAAIIGAGTGLGASHLVRFDDNLQPYASEAGHSGFAPESTLQTELLMWMQSTHSHVSLEMLLSGEGLINIYHFLHEIKGLKESLSVIEEMKLKDPSQVITEYALSATDKLCQETLDCFIDIYGATAGNIALHYYPIGELYIAGGIANKIKDRMVSSSFIDAFVNKGLLTKKMKQINVKLIVEDKVGVYGALVKLKSMYMK